MTNGRHIDPFRLQRYGRYLYFFIFNALIMNNIEYIEDFFCPHISSTILKFVEKDKDYFRGN